MKKILSLLCVTAMSFSLIACGGNTKKTTGETVVETEALESRTARRCWPPQRSCDDGRI